MLRWSMAKTSPPPPPPPSKNPVWNPAIVSDGFVVPACCSLVFQCFLISCCTNHGMFCITWTEFQFYFPSWITRAECKMFSLRRRSHDSPPMSTRNRGNHRGSTPLTSTPPSSQDHHRHPRCGICEVMLCMYMYSCYVHVVTCTCTLYNVCALSW